MKALVLTRYNQFDYLEVPEPRVGEEDVLIEVKACGICGSDVHGMDGSTGRRIPPVIMGHEASGVIVGLGGRVDGWSVGDRVTFDSTVSCGKCDYCRQGRINLCDRRRVLGVSCQEFRCDGAYAERVAVPQHILYRLPDDLTFHHAAMVEPVSVAVHAAGRMPLRLNDTVVVVGTGMIGLLVVQALRLSGCGRIIAVDLDRRKLDLASRLGADECLSPAAIDVARAVRERTDGRGADLVFEVVGLPATVSLAVDCCRKGGSVGLIGNVAPQVPLALQAVVTRELTLFGSCASSREYPACLELMFRGAIQVDAMISAVAPLSEGAAWFERLHRGDDGLMKVILQP